MYLVIEGVIGVGKTTLTQLLQTTFEARLLLEVFEENPFLSDFYGDRARYAMQTELFFLLSRYHQQRHLNDWLAQGPVLADFVFAKSALFAHINLTGDEWQLYHRLSDALAEKIPLPDLMVYLRAPTDLLLERIARRGRSYEKHMEPAYLDRLSQSYDEFFALPHPMPTLILEAAEYDFVNRPSDLQIATTKIQEALGLPAVQMPLGS